MSLQETVDALNSIAEEGRGLFDALKGLAENGQDASDEQKNKLRELLDSLETSSRDAARERRQAEIEKLDEMIRVFDLTLTVSGLDPATRDDIRAELIVARGRRTRLLNQQATDFGGILTKAETDELAELIAKAREEAQKKKFAAAFLDSVLNVIDKALTLAGKLAM